MTGYGKSSGDFHSKKVSVEIKSLNSKSLDLNVRIAPIYKELELEIRKIISTELDRGKVDLTITLENSGDAKTYSINQDLAKAYYNDIKLLADNIGEKSEDILAMILRMPDIFINEKEELPEEEKNWILSLVKDATNHLNEFRDQEGNALVKEFTDRINDIKSLLEQVPNFESERVTVIRERMRKSLEDLSTSSIDDNRLEQELIFYIEKIDISEEKMRLSNHLDYFLETMKLPAAGKKLGFISQEIGREINTLGSKSYHSEMQKLVVDMKDNLEKIKEQILNTL